MSVIVQSKHLFISIISFWVLEEYNTIKKLVSAWSRIKCAETCALITTQCIVWNQATTSQLKTHKQYHLSQPDRLEKKSCLSQTAQLRKKTRKNKMCCRSLGFTVMALQLVQYMSVCCSKLTDQRHRDNINALHSTSISEGDSSDASEAEK